jgi:tetratricopeptide (TPR) repeat protein
MSRTIAWSFLLLVSALVSAHAQDGPLFHFVEKAGPYAVGLNVVDQYDYSRSYRRATDEFGKPFRGERARPIQTLVWYPAMGGAGKPMTVGDYVKLWATESSFDKPKVNSDNKDWAAAMQLSLKMPLWAVRDAPMKPGHFPVLIYAPSFSAVSWENADLCEYLASHGYVVIASPDMGAATRHMTHDVAGINAQARDISFLIGYAHTLANTDTSAIAVAGFSWGGMSNLFAAARDNRINALVALDGSMRYFSSLVKEAGDVHPEEMTIPLIYFAQGEITFEEAETVLKQNNGPNVLNAWTHGDLVTVHMLGLTHREHASIDQRNEDVWRESFPQHHKADYGREDGMVGYGWIARYTLSFLDAYLKHDAAALAFLKKTPADNGVPKHFMTVNYRAASGTVASFDGFRVQVGREGFDHVTEIYASLQKEKADFKLDEVALEDWVDELITDGHVPEAIQLLKLDVQMYPESTDALTALAEAYRQSGQKQLAIDTYRKVLEKAPLDVHVKTKLQELGVL